MNQPQEPDRLEGILPKRVRNFHRRIWNKQEDQCLQSAVAQFGTRNWKAITAAMEGRSLQQCIQRWKSLKPNPGNRKEWMATEDNKLYELYQQLGPDWNKIQQQLPSRTAQQIRKRYINHVDPKLIKTPWTPEEDRKIVETYLELGPIWTHLSSQMEGRSENMIKNRFHSYLRNNYVIPMKEIPKPQSACFRTRIPKTKTELEAPPIEKHVAQSEQIPIQPPEPEKPKWNMQLINQQLLNVFQDSVSKKPYIISPQSNIGTIVSLHQMPNSSGQINRLRYFSHSILKYRQWLDAWNTSDECQSQFPGKELNIGQNRRTMPSQNRKLK